MLKTFYIIDGHAQIYRAYYAPFRDLTSPTGEPTRATFVFTQMLLNLVESRKPDYLAMVIDDSSEVPNFRSEVLPTYKANRPKRPDDFTPQETRILQIVRDAGVPIFVQPGCEADDVIATMVTRLADQDFDIYMVSKDKDLRQMLSDKAKMYDVHSDAVMDPAALENKVGYRPDEAIDVQTLMGDAIDNVRGIPGVGEKTAVKLVRKYGSADAVLNHLDELTPKMRENFEKYGEFLPRTRELVTLRRNVEMEFDPANCAFKGLDTNALRSHLSELGFTNLLKRLGDSGGAVKAAATPRPSAGLLPTFATSLFDSTPAPVAATSKPAEADKQATVAAIEGPAPETAASCSYHLIATDEQFDQFLADLSKQTRFAFDTETDDLGAMRSNLIGMSFSWEHGTGYYVPVEGPPSQPHQPLEKVLNALRPILENATIKKVGHNIKYDLLVMRNVGIALKGISLDSMVAAFLLDSSRMQYGIDRLALDLLNFQKVPTADLLGKGKGQISMKLVELPRVAAYASEDADITLRLADLLEPQLAKTPALKKLADDLETPLIDVLAEMEFNGVAIDPAMLREQSAALAIRIEQLREQIHTAAGSTFNIDSPKQLEKVLFTDLKLTKGKKTKTGYSTDVQVLERLAIKHPVPRLILDYRSLVKLKNTYLDNLTEYQNPRTGRVHGSFNQAGAGTGRLSMSDPNLQNIPIRTDEGRRIRLAFVPGDPDNNVLLTADYSQIELRMLAHFTQEPALMRAFENNEDIHRTVAAEVFGVALEDVTREQRGTAKTINFGIVYGVSAFGLSSRIEGLDQRAAQDLIDRYNRRFPGIELYTQKQIAHAREHGYVETILGRRRPITEINSSIIAQRRGAERAAGNSVIQGSAADLIKIAMLNLYRGMQRENLRSKMLLQVHDELVFETPKEAVETEAAVVRFEMEHAMTLSVPLRVEIGYGKNWQEVK